MVIDTSAILACLLGEPERASFTKAIEADSVRLLSVIGFVEASLIMLTRKRDDGLADLAAFLNDGEIDRVPVDAHQAAAAVEAFRRFGKGRHPARLNMGDCFAYALAKNTGEPLLFKGFHFPQTDVSPVI